MTTTRSVFQQTAGVELLVGLWTCTNKERGFFGRVKCETDRQYDWIIKSQPLASTVSSSVVQPFTSDVIKLHEAAGDRNFSLTTPVRQ